MRLVFSCLAIVGLSLAAPANPHIGGPAELVIGGHRAYQGFFPYYVYLHQCGGSLITPKHVLTAAHCVDKDMEVDPGWIGATVEMGVDDNEDLTKEGVQARKVANVVLHQGWNKTGELRDDIAILELEEPFNLTNYVQLIKIKADDTELQKHYWTTAIGFGLSDLTKNDDGTYSGVWPRYLQYAYIPLIPLDQCKKTRPKVWEKQVCIGGKRLGVGNGDSGGPLSMTDNATPYQIGIASYIATGQYYNQDVYPATFTRTASYCDWMTEKTNGAFRCI
ncbi:hypothetical protein QR680_014378 [Steinernema hermaphroditum]|uniref:Peptidase S1 domain-containing protein n=1 Tax=Steinernema hermaphroditum TaxID=289476 RepID=A0AA39M3T5_9BILA|nr:hypothetical protein QR680_014377 [Steinernema hermaphroditum]KAK0419868.1 hypothetical protein QR680_014378 [Steinernema hermaphroditum]